NAIELAFHESLQPMLTVLGRKRNVDKGASIVSLCRLLELGEERLVEASDHLVEAICLATGVSRILTDELIHINDYLSNKGLQELIYAARSGSPIFKQLAIRRLEGVQDRQATATQRQLIYDPEIAVA